MLILLLIVPASLSKLLKVSFVTRDNGQVGQFNITALNPDSPIINITVNPSSDPEFENLFEIGPVDPKQFLDTCKLVAPLSYDHVLFHSMHVNVGPIESMIDNFTHLDRLAAGQYVNTSQRLFNPTINCEGINNICTEASRFCKDNGGTQAACLDALEKCINKTPNDMNECFYKESVRRINFEKSYRTPTTYHSLADSGGVWLLSRRLVNFLARNADLFNTNLPNMELALGLWLAPMQDVDWVDLTRFLTLRV